MFRCIVGNHRVEITASHDVSVLRVHRVGRPLQFERPTVSGGAEAFVTVELGKVISQTHVAQLFDSSWGQTIATRLFTGEGLLLDDDAVVAMAGEPVSGRGAGRSTTDDQNLGREVSR